MQKINRYFEKHSSFSRSMSKIRVKINFHPDKKHCFEKCAAKMHDIRSSRGMPDLQRQTYRQHFMSVRQNQATPKNLKSGQIRLGDVEVICFHNVCIPEPRGLVDRFCGKVG